MMVIVEKHFYKQVEKCTNKTLKEKILAMVETIQKVKKITDIPNSKKMVGYASFYRIHIGDYRIGIELESPDTIRLICFEHRSKIYSTFP